MIESYNSRNGNRWYGKPFTKRGAAVMFVLMLVYFPMHEFGHWIAYWIFGIPAEFGIMIDPFVAFTVRPLTEPDIAIRMFASFFGGGLVFIVAGMIAIKSRPSLMIAVFGLAGGITELSFLLISGIDNIHHFRFLHSNMIWYAILQIVPIIAVAAFGFSEFRWWLKIKIKLTRSSILQSHIETQSPKQ